MAKKNYYSNGSKNRREGNPQQKKTSRASELRKLAYNLGQVQKGLKNPDSQISASYNAGMNKQKKEKKSLF